MTRFVGLDAHKQFVQVEILDAEGQRVHRSRCPTTRPALSALAEKVLEGEDEVALEATTNTWSIVELLEPHVARVVVSNPLKTRAIADAKVKTDKIDARILAELLRCRYLPEVWQPDALTRRYRELTHRRAALVSNRTAFKNRLHAVLAQRLIPVPCKKLFSKQGLEWLKDLELDADGREILDSDLRMLEAVEREIELLEQKLAELAYEQEQVRLLLSLPGFDVTVALGLISAWGRIDRFADADRAASYLGLAPSTRQSGNHCYHGRITKHGNSHVRWLLVQAAQHLDRHPGPLGVFFRRLAKKKGRNVAVVATARKLAVVAWHMLKNDEPYRYAQPQSTQAKLSRLRVRATGKRRQGGVARGSRRPEAYGTGQGTRRVPALHEIYASEDLPAARSLEHLASGERRILAEQEVETYVNSIQESRRVPRRRAAPA